MELKKINKIINSQSKCSTPAKRKRANYGVNLRHEIISKYNSSMTPKQLSEIYNVSASTIIGMVSKKSQLKVAATVSELEANVTAKEFDSPITRR